ncbi:hypothetical protein L2E82_22529 [Cichorium intybus]|uniref:Uncharacterized protein n=1 Tax=Cichorium intybus TaxID=13427 RepID=A0ACB9DYN4_CICIN|nr:hypothetical protein L2E82_22529 [Cichorium intybus]
MNAAWPSYIIICEGVGGLWRGKPWAEEVRDKEARQTSVLCDAETAFIIFSIIPDKLFKYCSGSTDKLATFL